MEYWYNIHGEAVVDKPSLVLITVLDSVGSISILELVLGNKLDVSELLPDKLLKSDVMITPD